MIESAKKLSNNTEFESEIAVVGSGAAGIPLALELAEAGHRVLLLESGSFKGDKQTQNLYSGFVKNEEMHSPTDKYRIRQFGGSTVLWGGRCMPFDPIDFEKRDYLPESGWPIQYDDLAPFYPKANEFLEAGYFEYNAREAFYPDAKPMFKGYDSDAFSTEGIERFSCPTDLGKRYHNRISTHPNIHCVYDANITYIQLSSDGSTVDFLKGKTLNGKSFKVRAKKFVLAMGGIETTRLLLASNDIHKNGIGNSGDVLGRYYMCHIAGNVGKLVVDGPTSDVKYGYEVSPEGIYCRRRIHLRENQQRELSVSNMVARLHFPKITDPSHKSGILSGLFFAKNFINYEYGKRLKDGKPPTISVYAKHFWNILVGPIETLNFLWFWLTRRTLAVRKFPSVILPNKSNQFSLEVHAEQIPNPESRITLSDQKDSLGLPKICVDWQYLAEDVEMVRKTLKAFSDDIKAQGVGTFEFDEENLENELMRFGAYGGHHIGTTRMGTSSQNSIVDVNCKVHEVEDLYIASSSVFPTSSQANPTLTITAMALRLADHINSCAGAK